MIKEESINDLLDRWEELREQGREPSAEELCSDSPELINKLEEQIKALKALEWLVDTDTNAAADSTENSLQTVSSDGVPVSSGPMPPASHVERPPSEGSRFEILAPYAKGGLGEVFRARDGELNREVALKEIQSQHAFHPEKQARFLREARITGNLEHPGIVPVYGLGQYEDGRPYYAMRFIKGDTLRDAIDRYHSLRAKAQVEASLELRKLLNRFIDVCNAIDYAHSRRVVHRDLKPANIMLGEYGETLVVDWGLAKLSTRRQQQASQPESSVFEQPSNLNETLMGTTVGTPAYMAPEQASGDLGTVGVCSDIYSLGATLYHLLVGKPPFTDRDTFLLLKKARNAEYEHPRSIVSTIPKALEAICLRAMSLQPEDRYCTAKALAEDIEHWLADEPIAVHREPLSERVSRWTRRHRGATLAGGVALTTVAVVSIVASLLVGQARQQESQAWESSAKNRLFELELLGGPTWDQGNLSELKGMLTDIETLSPDDAAVRRRRLFDTFSADMRSSLDKPRFADADAEAFSETLNSFSKTFTGSETLLTELRGKRDDRLSKWNELLDPRTLFGSGFGGIFDPEALHTEDGTIRRRSEITTDGVLPDTVRTRLACPAGNIELKATFGRNWTAGSVIGLVLNLSDNHRYDFLLTVPQFDYRDTTADDLSDLPSTASILDSVFSNRLAMYILRDGQPLVYRSLTVPQERLRLLARREGGRLSFTVNDIETVHFEDPFPLPSTEPGLFGLYFPKNVELEGMQALHLRTAQKPSAVERGDEMFAAAEFGDAEAAYRRIENAECEYKRALCLLRLQRTEEAVKILTELFNQPPGDKGDKNTPWRLRAGCSLLQHYVESKGWTHVDQILDELANYYSSKTIALLIPKSQIEQVLQHRRREQGFSSAFARGRSIADDLEWCIRVEELFKVDAVRRRDTKRTLSAIYTSYPFRINNGIAKPEASADILTKLNRELDKDASVQPYERIEHLLNLHFVLNHLGRTDEMIQHIDRWLLDESGEFRKEYVTLRVIRAACYWKKGRPDLAADELDQFLQSAGPKSHNDPVFRTILRVACIVRGMLHEDSGHSDMAQQTYRLGLRPEWNAREDIEDLPKTFYTQMNQLRMYSRLVLMSWTGQVTESDMKTIWDRAAPSSGVVSATVSRIAKTALTPQLLKGMVSRGLQTPESRLLIRKMTLGEELSNIEIYIHVWGAAVQIACLRDLELSDKESQELERIIQRECRKLVDAWYEGIYGEKELLRGMNLWRGKFEPREFQKLINKHPDRRFSLFVAFVFGSKFALDGKPNVARHIFDMVLKDKDASAVAVREIKRKLARMEREKRDVSEQNNKQSE